MQIFHPARLITVPYQLALLCLTSIILGVLLYKPFVEFHPVGAEPVIKQVPEQKTSPLMVRTGLHITDFLRFDTVKNEFVVNAFIWFEYDPEKVPQKMIDAFAFTKGELLQKSEPILTKQGPLTRALYTIRVQFSTILNFSRFPLDDHRIFLNLVNQQSTATELVYEVAPENFTLSPTIYVAGWVPVGHTVKSGVTPITLSKNSEVMQHKTVFALDLSKSDIRQLMLIILPLLFLFYVGLFAFSIQDMTVAMTLPMASISGLFAYSFVIQILAPPVGYMMMSDYLFIFFLISTFIIFIVKALAIIPETHLSRARHKTIEGVTSIVLQIALIVVWYILLDVRGI